jgi:chaperonin GroEL
MLRIAGGPAIRGHRSRAMPKQLMFDDEARRKIHDGIRKLADAVRVTLGPTAKQVILDKKFGTPLAVNDGVTIAKEIELPDPFENMGAKLVAEVASKTNDVAGDGTSTAILLTESIYSEGLRQVTAGSNPVALQRGIAKAVEAAVASLREQTKPVKGREDMVAVATIAANNDPALGALIADAMEEAGREGVIAIEEGKSIETTRESVGGMQFDKGYISPYFITDVDRLAAVLEEPYILLSEKKIANLKEFIPLLERVAPTGKPLLVIAEEVEGDALAALVINKLRGGLVACAVKAPAFGDRRKAILQDMAILTGGTVLSDELGRSLEKFTVEDLGRAQRVTVEKERTTIVGGGGSKDAVAARVAQLRMQHKQSTSEYDKEKLHERLAKLQGGVSIIKVGGMTEAAMKERKYRVEDAVNASRAAADEGIVPGGGLALLNAVPAVDRLAETLEGDEALGARILARALETPLRQIAANAGEEGAVAVAEARERGGAIGFNARNRQWVDLMQAGIIDPVKVTRTGLQNAASVSTLLLTSRTLLTDLKEKAKSVAGSIT